MYIRAFAFFSFLALAGEAAANPVSTGLTTQGIDLLSAEKYSEAVSTFNQAVAADPADAEAKYHLGVGLLKLGKNPEGLEALRQAEAGGYPAGFALGVAYFQGGFPAAAEPKLRTALKEDPQNTEASLYLGLTLFKLTQYAQAVSYLAGAEATPDFSSEARFYRGLALLRQGKQDEAVDVLKSVAKEDESVFAGQANEVLRGLGQASAFGAQVSLLHQTDTNVLLVQTNRNVAAQSYSPNEISNKLGNRLAAVVGIAYGRKIMGDYSAGVAYDGYQSLHYTSRAVLKEFDVGSHGLTLQGNYTKSKWKLTLPVRAGIVYLGSAGPYSRNLALTPRYERDLTAKERIGMSYGADFEVFGHRSAPLDIGPQRVSTDRSNTTHTVTADYSNAVTGHTVVAPALSLFSSTAHGPDNIWSYRGARLSVAVIQSLPYDLTATCSAAGGVRDFGADYPVERNGRPSDADHHEKDFLGQLRLRWQPATWNVQGGVAWQRNLSKIDQFDYNRAVFTLGVGAEL